MDSVLDAAMEKASARSYTGLTEEDKVNEEVKIYVHFNSLSASLYDLLSLTLALSISLSLSIFFYSPYSLLFF